MKSESPLFGCFAKIEVAKTDIDNLQARIGTIFKPVPRLNVLVPKNFPGDRPRELPKPYPTGFYKSVANIDANGIEVWRFVLPEIPAEFNVSVGNILHNLRSPLDQMLSAVALLTHDSPHGVAFPFGRTRDEFKAALNKQKKLPCDALRMIEALKPYRAKGNVLLHAIHALNTPDKHHPGLIPINLSGVTSSTGLGIIKGLVLTFGPRTGRHWTIDMDGNWSQPNIAQAPGFDLTDGSPRFLLGTDVPKPATVAKTLHNQLRADISARFPDLASWIAKTRLPKDAPKDNMEIATAIPGTQFEAEVEPSLDIALGNIEGFEREPVVAVLHKMRQLVERILLTFEKRFFP